MKKAIILTNLSIVIGFLGVAALILAWLAERRGLVFGFTTSHWYSDAMILMLIAIWLKLGAWYHKGE